MSKTNRLYKIFMTSMIVIIAGLLLATGIIAIQKQMKLKANIEFLPGINVEIFVKNEDNPTETLIFRNFEDTSDANNKKYIEFNSTYCELSANTLTMKDAFVTAYGNNFTLIVKNYSGFTIETNITSTATAKIGEEPVDAVVPEITPATAQIATGKSGEFVVTCEPIIPQETIISIQFKEPPSLTVNFTFSGDTSVANSEDYFIVVITNDPGFDMATDYTDTGVHHTIWKSSYDSTYYGHAVSFISYGGTYYTKKSVTELIPDTYTAWDYEEYVTDYRNVDTQQKTFEIMSGYKVYIYASYPYSSTNNMYINSITTDDVDYTTHDLGNGFAGLEFEVPKNDVTININGYYYKYESNNGEPEPW